MKHGVYLATAPKCLAHKDYTKLFHNDVRHCFPLICIFADQNPSISHVEFACFATKTRRHKIRTKFRGILCFCAFVASFRHVHTLREKLLTFDTNPQPQPQPQKPHSKMRASTTTAPSFRAKTGLRSISRISGKSVTSCDSRSRLSMRASRSAAGISRKPLSIS